MTQPEHCDLPGSLCKGRVLRAGPGALPAASRRRGERFDRRRHACGTEVKAITYSAMQISERTAQGDAEVFVIVDI